jgi:thiol:disulfide interchange protein
MPGHFVRAARPRCQTRAARAYWSAVTVLRWLTLCIFISSCAAPDLGHATLPFAIEAASSADRPLVVELSATWCKPCQVFASQVLTDPRLEVALRDVLFVRYDVDTPPGRDAMARCRVRGIPAVLGIDHDGFVRLEKLGTEPTADEFLVFLRQVHQVLAPR